MNLEKPKKVVDKVTIENIEKMEMSFAKKKFMTCEKSQNTLDPTLVDKTDKSTMSSEKDTPLNTSTESKNLFDYSTSNEKINMLSKLKSRRHTIDSSTLHRIRELTDDKKHFSAKSLPMILRSPTRSKTSFVQVSY